MKTYVVDMNVLQSTELEDRILAEPDSRFVLPDVAFVEMCKHDAWELTMRLALNVFAGHGDRIKMSLSVGEAINVEIETLEPAASNTLLPPEFTNFACKLIEELAQGRQGEAYKIIQEEFSNTRQELLTVELDAPKAKARTQKLLDQWLSGLAPQIMTAIRKPSWDRSFFLSLVQVNAELFCLQYLESLGVVTDYAHCFMARKPMLLRYFYALTRHSLLAAKVGRGFSAMKVEKELNHQLDLEYGLVATYFDALLSGDKRAKEAYDDLVTILMTPSDIAVAQLQQGLRELKLLPQAMQSDKPH